jgi:hypothetical protein
MSALPPIVDQQTWRAALEDLRKREKAATRTWHTTSRGVEQLNYSFALMDVLPVRPPGGVAGLPGRLAAGADGRRLAEF